MDFMVAIKDQHIDEGYWFLFNSSLSLHQDVSHGFDVFLSIIWGV